MGEGLNKPLFSQRCLQTFYIFLSRALADISKRTKEKYKTTSVYTVRLKGGMSLRNGMWHELRNDIIMWNVIYAD